MPVAEAKPRLGFRHALFATDFSASADLALPYAVSIARRFGSTLYVTHIVSRRPWLGAAPEETPHSFDQRRRQAERQLSKVLNAECMSGIPEEAILQEGDIRAAMSHLVENREIDLVVVGSHGRHGIRRLLLGSKAEDILEATTCPVLIVGPRVVPEKTSTAMQRVLFPTDFTPEALPAIPYALLLASHPECKLMLLHAVEEPPRNQLRDPERTVNYLRTRLQDLIPADAALACKAELAIGFGSAAQEILRTAKEWQADVIVLGEHRAGPYAAHLLGNTAYDIVCHAPCPVLAVCTRKSEDTR